MDMSFFLYRLSHVHYITLDIVIDILRMPQIQMSCLWCHRSFVLMVILCIHDVYTSLDIECCVTQSYCTR